MRSDGSELPLEKELAIHAGIAGIVLAHQSTLILSVDNELSRLANLVAVFSIIGVITAYVDTHFETATSGLRIARTTTAALVTYLVLVAVIGTVSVLGLTISGVWIATTAAVIPMLVLIYGLFRRVKLLYPYDSLTKCIWKDIEEQRMLQHHQDHPSPSRTGKQTIFSILMSLLVLLWVGDTHLFLIGTSGMLTSLLVAGLLGLGLYNPNRVGIGPKGFLVPPYGVALFVFLLT